MLTGHFCVSDQHTLGYLVYGFDTWLTPPVSVSVSAMQQVLDNAGEAPASAGANDIDLLFLRGIMESPTVRSS